MDLRKNAAWVRKGTPVIRPDGVFADEITMNPCAYVEDGTIYLFYAGADAKRKVRNIRLATASLDAPEDFTFRGVVLDTAPAEGDYDHAWCVLPHVVKLGKGRYLMIYTGNRGSGAGLSAFPGLGAAFSNDLIHWEKYEGNPVFSPGSGGDVELIGIAGGGLLREELEGGGFRLHLFYTGCPTLGDNIFLDQQKCCCHAVSTDGVHWTDTGVAHRRRTEADYENIAATGGPVLIDGDGLWRHWYSCIGTRWGVYSIGYAESEDGLHWNKGERVLENLALGPKMRDIGELHFLPMKERWEDDSVSYPTVIRQRDGSLRMYYCGNDYGVGGIGTAVSARLRLSPTGGEHGETRVWRHGDGKRYLVRLADAVRADGQLFSPCLHRDGYTPDGSSYFEESCFDADGREICSVRAIAVNREDHTRLDLFIENKTDRALRGIELTLSAFTDGLKLSFSDAQADGGGGRISVRFPDIGRYGSACVHGRME